LRSHLPLPESLNTTNRKDHAMLNATEVRAWLATLPDDALVGIDEGGITLQALDSDAYLDVGGMPPGTAKPGARRARRSRR
jgi:hypothetical protein